MSGSEKRRGPWIHRALIVWFAAVLTVLLVWLLEFVLSDVGKFPGPDYKVIEEKYVATEMTDRLKALNKDLASLEKQIADQREIQGILLSSTQNSQETMNQLVSLHKLNLEKGVKPTEVEQQALAESEAQFLENQKRFQVANETIAQLSEKQRDVNRQIAALEETLGEKRLPAREEYDQAKEVHALKVAAVKLAIVVPLLFAAAWLVMTKRASAYAPLAYAAFGATFWTTGRVMYQNFPREYFKYIAIGAAIVIVLALLVHLIRMLTAPKRDWLLKQYKEAYNKRLCPVCAFPIQRGPFKGLVWTRRGPRGVLPVPKGGEDDEEKPYTCPSCGEALYVACQSCGKSRHALLPYCQHCGAEAGGASQAAP